MPTVPTKTVSIIIPVYNTARFLDECLESVVNQTYSNLEILLINDGSKDNSLELCQKWAEKDQRIKVFNNSNHGVSFTRNFGLDNCSGEYVAFIDSDDVVSVDYIKTMVDMLVQHGSDMSVISYTCFYNDQQPNFVLKESSNKLTSDIENVFFSISSGVICSKLYLKKLISDYNIRFDESIAVTEDLLFNLNYVSHCNSLVFNSSKLYGYRQRENSAAHDTVSLKWFTCLNVYKQLFEEYSNNSAYAHIVFYYLKNLYEAKYSMRKNHISSEDIDFDVLNEIKSAEKKIKLVSFRRRIKLFICKHFFSVVIKHRK